MFNLLNHLKISNRIYLFFSVSFFSMLFIIFSNYFKLNQLGKKLEIELISNQKKADYVLEINVIALNKVRKLLEIISTKDIETKKKGLVYIDSETKRVTEIFKIFESEADEGKEKKLVFEANEKRKLFVVSKEKVLALSLINGKENEIIEILSVETLPRLKNYLEQVNEVNLVIKEKTFLITKKISEDNSSNARFQIIFLVFFLAIKLLMLFWIIRSIHKPLYQTVKTVTEISNGNFKNSIEYDKFSKDEFTLMLIGLDRMKSNLSTSIQKIKEVTSSILDTNGNLVQISSNLNTSAVDLASSSEETSASTEEVAATIENVSSKISKQTLEINQINSNLMILNNSISEIKVLSENLSKNSLDSLSKVQNSEKTIDETIYSMDRIKSSSVKINEIISLISEISSQTNLLALNASIEAARAGESGRGFAIVADSINKLADRTSSSVKQIQVLIQESVSSIEEGYNKVSNLSKNLKLLTKGVNQINESIHEISKTIQEQSKNSNEITSNSEKISSFSNEISIASNEQKIGMSEINTSVLFVSNNAQTVSSEAVVIKELSDEFNEQVIKLKESISIFKFE